ncbi:MAG: HAD-IA family hydrolase [Kiritimatiellae bacterium]|nr:HAD-IA family hydrolase [Kiritimatiellia bacterium]
MNGEAQKRGLAIYDLDGTLIDSRADLTAAVNRARAGFGMPPLTMDMVVAFVGDGQRKLVERALAGAPVTLDEGVAAVRREYAAGWLQATALYPGVREALQRLRQAGWLQAVVTNKPAAATDAILAGLGARGFFDAVVGAEEGLALKPDPAPLRLAMQRTGWMGAGEVWMVGDHYTDLEAGRRAGLKRCYCRYGFGRPGAEQWDLAVDDLRELADRLAPAGEA